MAAGQHDPVRSRVRKGKTQGLSPKTILAGVLPAVVTLIAVVVQWAVTGEFDRAELVTAIMGLVTAASAALGAYLADPGDVRYPAGA
jgi:hypothetical protein